MKKRTVLIYFTIIILGTSLLFSSDNIKMSGEVYYYKDNGEKIYENKEGIIIVGNADLSITGKDGVTINDISFDAFTFQYQTIKKVSLIDNKKILKIDYGDGDNKYILKLKTIDIQKLYQIIKTKIDQYDFYEQACVIYCIASNGNIIFNNIDGKIILDKEKCTLEIDEKSEDSISSISFKISQIQKFELDNKNNIISFHTCNDKVCDKLIELKTEDIDEIKEMVLKYQKILSH